MTPMERACADLAAAYAVSMEEAVEIVRRAFAPARVGEAFSAAARIADLERRARGIAEFHHVDPDEALRRLNASLAGDPAAMGAAFRTAGELLAETLTSDDPALD